MRQPSLAGPLVFLLLIGSATLISKPGSEFTVHQKAFYADPNLVNFVRPGLVTMITGAEIAADGTIRARFKLTDPRGLPLDRDGVTTPGSVSTSFIAATIHKGRTQYTSYTTRTQTSPITQASAVQAASDSGGTYTKTGEGEYAYTFQTKAPSGVDRNATHSIGVYSSRSLSEFDLGTQYSSDVLNFVPDGSRVATTRDVVRTESCNKCHDELAFHGGSRRGVELCVLCHTPQTIDPDTGNTLDMTVMTHRIHMGRELPSVIAGRKYTIIGFNQNVIDYSTVGYPAGTRNCESCHEAGSKAAQANAWLQPSRAACGSCHDNVNFATGENHVDLPQVSDNQCATCHIPQGELEFDASIKGAHVNPEFSPSLPGVVATIVKVDDGSAGKRPTVTFTLRDRRGAGIPLSQMNRVALVMAGPTTDFGATKFAGADTPGYVSEGDMSKMTCASDGTCTYTFDTPIPADAKGTFSIGIEARRQTVLLAGTRKEVTAQYGAFNRVAHFSVDGSTVRPRRKVVAIEKCNQCHSSLSEHGANRNNTEHCVLCHNPAETDISRRPMAQVAADRAGPPQGVNFALMIHRIHTGEHLKAEGREYTVVGFGGSHNDYTEVRYPAFSPNGQPGDLRNCDMCHVDNSQQLPLPAGLLDVADPRGPLNPVGPVTSACTGCHVSIAAASHALANTTRLGESCAACHASGREASVDRVHAR